MANIVDISYFKGEININTGTASVTTLLNDTITQNENKHIVALFGKYSVKWVHDHVFVPATEDDAAVNPDYELFYNGGSYTDIDGNEITFYGLKTILAYFLYSDLLFSEEYLNTSMGNIATKERTSTYSLTYTKVESTAKKTSVYNRAVDMYAMLCEYMLLEESIFPDNFEIVTLDKLNVYGI